MRTLFALILALSFVGCVLEPQQPELQPPRAAKVEMSVTAWKSPASCGQLNNDWTNPTRAYAHDTLRATANGTSEDYYNFGFTTTDLPSGSIIDGYEVRIENRVGSGDMGEIDITMVRNGASYFALADNNPQQWTETSDTYKTFGSATDLGFGSPAWLDTDWTGGSTSGVTCQEDNSVNNSVNHIQIRIYYHAAPSQTARVTEVQADVTYNRMTGRVTAVDADATYTQKTGRVTAVQGDLTYGLKTIRVTAAEGTLIYNPMTGRVTAGSVDLVYNPMTGRITALDAEVDCTPTLGARVTAVEGEATSTQKTARVTGVQSKAWYDPTEPCDPYARVMAAQADVTFARTDALPHPAPQENPPLYFCTSWHYPTACGQIKNEWATPEAAYAAGSPTSTSSNAANEEDYYGFDFTYDDIPQAATISGVELELWAGPVFPATEGIIAAQLVREGAAVGATIPNGFLMEIPPHPTKRYGGETTLWDTTWTPANFINPNTGVYLVTSIDGAGGMCCDYVRMRVWCTVSRAAWISGIHAHCEYTTVDDTQPKVIRSYVIGGGVTATVTSGVVTSGTTKGIVESGVIRGTN